MHQAQGNKSRAQSHQHARQNEDGVVWCGREQQCGGAEEREPDEHLATPSQMSEADLQKRRGKREGHAKKRYQVDALRVGKTPFTRNRIETADDR